MYYKYNGLISSYSIKKPLDVSIADIMLYNPSDYTIPPTRLQAYGELADYIHELECTDDEERYIEWEFYYDTILTLAYIVIPSHDVPSRPAKVLTGSCTGDNCKSTFRIFGNPDHINTPKPKAMTCEEYSKWLDYKLEHFSRR